MDNIDLRLLEILNENSKLTNKEIGQRIHITGQAVGNRIVNLQMSGIIKKFSISINHRHTQFIRVFMDSNKYNEFEKFVNNYQGVSSFYKVSGQACYMIVSHFSEIETTVFIEGLSKFGRYTVETVLADKFVHTE